MVEDDAACPFLGPPGTLNKDFDYRIGAVAGW